MSAPSEGERKESRIIRDTGGCGAIFRDEGKEVVCIREHPCTIHDDVFAPVAEPSGKCPTCEGRRPFNCPTCGARKTPEWLDRHAKIEDEHGSPVVLPVAEQETEMENGRPLEEAFQLRIDDAVLRGGPVALSHDMARQITVRLREGRNEIARLRARPAEGEVDARIGLRMALAAVNADTMPDEIADEVEPSIMRALADCGEEDAHEWLRARQPTEDVAEALEELYRAADAYDADPVNAYDRPSSWGKLDALLESVAALRTLTEEGT